jgi:hypothetical protein
MYGRFPCACRCTNGFLLMCSGRRFISDWASGALQANTSTEHDSGDILRATMETETRAVALGHLTVTVPVVVITAATVRFFLYTFGPMLMAYFVFTGVALSWQWYMMAIARWKESLANRGFQCDEIEKLAWRSGLQWPGASSIGAFALHTAAAEMCAANLGPWLVYHWFGWMLPLFGISTTILGTDYYLQHLEIMSIVPALIVGYVVARHLPRLAATAWMMPTAILSYKLWTFVDPRGSVLVASNYSVRFSYYFDIVSVMPNFRDLYRSDPLRVVQQMLFVAPFYSGIAYSAGAFLSRWRILDHFVGTSVAVDTESNDAAGHNHAGAVTSAAPPSDSAT